MTANEKPKQDPTIAARRRRRIWLMSLTVGLAVVLATVVFAPSQLARMFVAGMLDRAAVTHQGLASLEVELLAGRVSAGPLSIGEGDEIGSVDAFRAIASPTSILSGRALLENVEIEGPKLVLRWDTDGRLRAAGIAIEGGVDEAAPFPLDPGIDSLTATDGRLTLVDFTGARLDIDIDRIELRDLRSWEPDTPAAVLFEGAVNGIPVRYKGTLAPFAEPARASLGGDVEGATIERLRSFLGETGLAEEEGTLSWRTHHDLAMPAEGGFAGTSGGEFWLDGVAIATPEGERLTADGFVGKFDLRHNAAGDAPATIEGEVTASLGRASLTSVIGETIEVSDAAIKLADARLRQAQPIDRASLTQIVGQAAGAGRSLSEFILELALALAEVFLSNDISLRATPSGDVRHVLVAVPSSAEQPRARLAVTQATLAPHPFSLTIEEHRWSIDTALTGSLAETEARLGEADTKAVSKVARTTLEIGRITAESDFEATAVEFDLAMTYQDIANELPGGGSATLGKIRIATPRTRVFRDSRDRTSADGEVTMEVGDFAVAAPPNLGGARVAGRLLRADLPASAVLDASQLNGRISGRLALEGWSAESTEGLPRTAIERAEINFTNLDAGAIAEAVLDAPGTAADPASGPPGEVALSIEGLAGAVPGPNGPRKLRARTAGARVAITGGQLQGVSGQLTAGDLMLHGNGITGRVASTDVRFSDVSLTGGRFLGTLEGLRGEPTEEQGRKVEAAADRLEVDLTAGRGEPDFDAVAGPGISGDLALTGVRVAESGDAAHRLTAGRIEISELDTGGGQASVGRLTLEDLEIDLTERVFSFGSGSGPDAADRTADGGSSAAFRIGSVEVARGSRVIFTDVLPNGSVAVEIGIDSFVLGPLDGIDPLARSDFDATLLLNRHAPVRVSGFAQLMAEIPDLDIAVDLRGLPLPPFSPYAVEALGLRVGQGALSLDLTARAQEGALSGRADLLVEGLEAEPASKEAAAAFREESGVSAHYALGLLRDSEGTIRVSLPLSGTLEDPSFGMSDIVAQAAGGVIASLLPFNWFEPETAWNPTVLSLPFPPGSVRITKEADRWLVGVANAARAEPNLPVAMCGVATVADLAALRGSKAVDPASVMRFEAAALQTLAVERAAVARDHLATLGVDPARFGECESGLTDASGAVPGVVFQVDER